MTDTPTPTAVPRDPGCSHPVVTPAPATTDCPACYRCTLCGVHVPAAQGQGRTATEVTGR